MERNVCFNQEEFMGDILYSKHFKELALGVYNASSLPMHFKMLRQGEILSYSYFKFVVSFSGCNRKNSH